MPVYEFYCPDCHTVFNFLSRRINTDKKPDCPRCSRLALDRRVSPFAFSRGRRDEPADGLPDLDEERMEKALAAMAGEMEGADENDPRQMARLMRKFGEVAGIRMDGMDEAIARLDAGEDPERVEEEMGDLFDEGSLFGREGVRGLKRRLLPPDHDDTLYPL